MTDVLDIRHVFVGRGACASCGKHRLGRRIAVNRGRPVLICLDCIKLGSQWFASETAFDRCICCAGYKEVVLTGGPRTKSGICADCSSELVRPR